MFVLRLAGYALLATLATAIVTLAIAATLWDRATSHLVENMYQAAHRAPVVTSLDGLPAPVLRFIRAAKIEARRPIERVSMEQVGEFRTEDEGDAWLPFEATQHVTTAPPGFVWDASIRMAPMVTTRIRDGYVSGDGSMQGKLLSLVTVVDERDNEALTRGALQRFLAEAAWYPTALLPSERLKWRAIDDTSAEATLSDSGIEVAAIFRFGPSGEIAEVSAERPRAVDGSYVPTPWHGRFSSYAERNGVRIPTEGEAGWKLPEGTFTYWRGQIVEIVYD